MDLTINVWLAHSILQEDTKELPWNKAIRYVPIETVKDKIAFMEQTFAVTVHYFDNEFYSTNDPFNKDIFFSATIRIEIRNTDGSLFKSLAGSATFSKGQYEKSFQYAPIAKSLAIVNAFSSEYPQFGKGLNVREDFVSEMSLPGKSNNFSTSNQVKDFQKKL